MQTISSDGEIVEELRKSLVAQFEPFFESFRIDKKAFVVHVINLILVIILISVPVKIIIDRLTFRESNSISAMQIFVIVLLVAVTSLVTDKKILQWQTLFYMEFNYAKKWLRRLVALNFACYVYHERYLLKNIFKNICDQIQSKKN